MRIKWARFFIRLGKFIQSLALMVMRPGDLIEFNRRFYTGPENVEGWGRQDLVDSGLDPDEMNLLEKIRLRSGRLLVLGVGGGREAVSFARMGFEVTGMDFVPAMVDKACENAARHGLKINGLVQDISVLDVPAGSYDLVWLSSSMYSSIPTSGRRIDMLKRIAAALKSGGYFICQFGWEGDIKTLPVIEFVKKALAGLSLGYLQYQKGDTLRWNSEFIHSFSSIDELKSEFNAGGFEIEDMEIFEYRKRGGAVLIKL